MSSLPLHPMLVHIPLALAIVMPLVTIGLLVAFWKDWLPSGAWWIAVLMQLVLVGGGFAAMSAGEDAEEQAEHVVPEHIIEQHAEAGETFVWTSTGVLALAILGLALTDPKRRKAVQIVTLVGTFVVAGMAVYAGDLGGKLVYVHGAASAYTQGAKASPGDKTGGGANSKSSDDDDDD